MKNYPERGSSMPCKRCGVVANQHTLRESAKCDGIKNGHLDKQGKPLKKAA